MAWHGLAMRCRPTESKRKQFILSSSTSVPHHFREPILFTDYLSTPVFCIIVQSVLGISNSNFFAEVSGVPTLLHLARQVLDKSPTKSPKNLYLLNIKNLHILNTIYSILKTSIYSLLKTYIYSTLYSILKTYIYSILKTYTIYQ